MKALFIYPHSFSPSELRKIVDSSLPDAGSAGQLGVKEIF